MVVLTKRENATKKRIDNADRAVELVSEFFDKGFAKSLIALSEVVKKYYPEMHPAEINNFWHFRCVNDDLLTKMENVLEQLKKE